MHGTDLGQFASARGCRYVDHQNAVETSDVCIMADGKTEGADASDR
jgi:hypothetical protein